jgi:hypothetical protein
VDLHVPVQGFLAYATGRRALGIEAPGQLGDRLLEALRDGSEMLLVAGDQCPVGLGTEAVGKIKRARSQVTTPNFRRILGSACDYAARPGSCGKPPGAL